MTDTENPEDPFAEPYDLEAEWAKVGTPPPYTPERELVMPWHEFTSLEEPEWLVEGFVQQGQQTQFFGGAGVGKSLLAMHLALAVLEGAQFLNYYDCRKGTVMWVDYENGAYLFKDRIEAHGFPLDEGTDIAWFHQKMWYIPLPSLALDDTYDADRLLAVVDRFEPDLLVIDSLGLATEGEENAADTFTDMGRTLFTPLKTRGVATLIMDNTGKEASRGSRGSSRKKDEATYQFGLEETAVNTYQLTCHKDRTGAAPKAVAFKKEEEPYLHWQATTPKTISKEAILVLKQMQELRVTGQSIRAVREAGVTGRNQHIAEAVKWAKTHPNGAG